MEINDDLKAQHHKHLAEKVVDMKIVMEKINNEDREESLKQHIDRSEDSLNDTLSDLTNEMEKLEEENSGYEPGEEEEDPGLNEEEENVDTDLEDKEQEERIKKML